MSKNHIQLFLFFLVVWMNTGKIYSQSQAKYNTTVPCPVNFIRNLDTLKFYIDEIGTMEQVRRRIQMVKMKGNWFRVQYDDSKGAIALRKIHRHRIYKFFKLYEKLKASESFDQKDVILQMSIESRQCSDAIFVHEKQSHKLKRMKHVLKIWK